jgi:hypothetical protein
MAFSSWRPQSEASASCLRTTKTTLTQGRKEVTRGQVDPVRREGVKERRTCLWRAPIEANLGKI